MSMSTLIILPQQRGAHYACRDNTCLFFRGVLIVEQAAQDSPNALQTKGKRDDLSAEFDQFYNAILGRRQVVRIKRDRHKAQNAARNVAQ